MESNREERITAWVTKHALTLGVLQVEGEVCANVSYQMFKYGEHNYAHGEGRQWHRTQESALARAESMRKAKIASLRKSIARLEALSFAREAA